MGKFQDVRLDVFFIGFFYPFFSVKGRAEGGSPTIR
jgi:hypothetical protein